MTDISRNRHRDNPESILAHRDNQSHASHQRTKIYSLAIERGGTGITCEEASIELQIPYQSCSARFSEMKRDGLLLPTLFTRQTRQGSQARVMFADEVVKQ